MSVETGFSTFITVAVIIIGITLGIGFIGAIRELVSRSRTRRMEHEDNVQPSDKRRLHKS